MSHAICRNFNPTFHQTLFKTEIYLRLTHIVLHISTNISCKTVNVSPKNYNQTSTCGKLCNKSAIITNMNPDKYTYGNTLYIISD